MVGAGKINHNSDASGGILAMCGPAPGIVITDQPGHRAGQDQPLYQYHSAPRRPLLQGVSWQFVES